MTEIEIWSHGNRSILLPDNRALNFGVVWGPNTIKSFWAAKEIGVSGIEADICLSFDKELIVYHPGSTKTDLQGATLKEIQSLYPNVPSFDDLITFLIGFRHLKCILDLKTDSPELVEAVVKKLQTYELRERVFLTASRTKLKLMGFYNNAKTLSYAKKIDPQIKTHLIDLFPYNLARTGKKFDVDMISFGWFKDSIPSRVVFAFLMDNGFRNVKKEVERAKRAGIYVLGGIPDTQEDINYFLEAGVDGVITNEPATAIKICSNTKP